MLFVDHLKHELSLSTVCISYHEQVNVNPIYISSWISSFCFRFLWLDRRSCCILISFFFFRLWGKHSLYRREKATMRFLGWLLLNIRWQNFSLFLFSLLSCFFLELQSLKLSLECSHLLSLLNWHSCQLLLCRQSCLFFWDHLLL